MVGVGNLRTAFRRSHVVEPIYTGGPLAVSQDGERLITSTDALMLSHIPTQSRVCYFAGDDADYTSLALSPCATLLAAFSASLSLFLYSVPPDNSPQSVPVKESRKISRAHDAPVHSAIFDPSSNLIASGAADGVAKVWDAKKGYVTHQFKGHGGAISCLAFHILGQTDISSTRFHLISASVDTRIRIFDLSSENSRSANAMPLLILEGHSSVPRGLSVSPDGKWLLSGGRDAVAFLWKYPQTHDRSQNSASPSRTIPLYERVEAIGFLPTSNGSLFYAGGESGILRIWDIATGRIHLSSDAIAENNEKIVTKDRQEIQNVFSAQLANALVVVYADQNLTYYAQKDLISFRHVVGYNDEIVASSFLSDSGESTDSHIALATNSSIIRVYSLDGFDSRLLHGHSDIVLCLATAAKRHMLASGGKDNNVRIWAYKPAPVNGWCQIALCEGHTESVGSLVFPKKPSAIRDVLFVFSGSGDRTIKMWDLSLLSLGLDGQAANMKTLCTLRAHEKDINSLDISPDDSLLVSGSQDKTAKIFRVEYSYSKTQAQGSIQLLGVCNGHKRGIWDVRFSPTEKILATASGDKTIKIWNLDDFQCQKTFEGHTNSVLKVEFLNKGTQLASSASDGLVKIWSLAEESCIATLDNHEEKIWALSISSDERMIVSGAADSKLTFWEDCTESELSRVHVEKTEKILQEQSFISYMAMNDYRNALLLALSMDQPGKLLSFFQSIMATPESFGDKSWTGHAAVDVVIKNMTRDELARLLKHIRTWNSNARTSGVAQRILHAVLKLHPYEYFTQSDPQPTVVHKENTPTETTVSELNDLVASLIPYTERHLKRMDRLLQESYIIDLIIREMDGGLIVDDTDAPSAVY